ncbi:MAG: MerR family transcriptional regulator [Clostridium sp.]|jgi:DNA-binding transcriptional MerR regulator|uniref:MerR family transcriptional regulator n=1 Tax=Clostridium sp. TaxID=1506 RepID=UPI0025C0E654|nr:MerR family transcriptional regulator [Clostridium sp.]MCH3965215.1 MerR family transcriptional regulator [Clostridium sp.]MCI1714435.1 MerR family transcriptional regulator [Clostridium sp.]MCI1798697.1 MerR family transcriptional regulator [Clostridium sp.]MCI1812572.1 MerR family transcriptional regulator [Clostridium sp.]MCI1869507.1 MerR family transcriptional regulator [Clostridium sp.]
MLIKEVCEKCRLTKKAIKYYEAKGLINPHILENGYRDYSDHDISTLKEISVLRRCGISTAGIKKILASSNKPSELAKFRYVTELRIQHLDAIKKFMTNLIEDYDINREFDYMQVHDKNLYTIKEKLIFAFPGDYGLFLTLHFGRFLNESVDSCEKQKAYEAIVNYLDNVDLYLSEELSKFLEAFLSVNGKIDIAELETEMNNNIIEVISDTGGYLERHHEEIEQYIEYKNSDEYKNSTAAKIQQAMRTFQQKSGYREILVCNMKILSKSYCEYLQNLEAANEIMLKKYPGVKNI